VELKFVEAVLDTVGPLEVPDGGQTVGDTRQELILMDDPQCVHVFVKGRAAYSTVFQGKRVFRSNGHAQGDAASDDGFSVSLTKALATADENLSQWFRAKYRAPEAPLE
jgi:hypothetical protein